MRNAFLSSILLILCSMVWRPVAAQEVPVRDAARAELRPDVREKIALADTLVGARTRRVQRGRVDAETGVFRARYRIRERVVSGLGPEEAALRHLSQSPLAYGIDSREHLVVESVTRARRSTHVRLRQSLEGVPVYGAEIKVSLDDLGRPTMVLNGYLSHLDEVTGFDATPRISAGQAIRITQNASTRGLDTSEPELVVFPSKPARLAWRLSAHSRVLPANWEVLVDAVTGEIIRMLDVTLHAHGTVDLGVLESRTAPAGPPDFVPAMRSVDGTGMVFDPDPLTSAGVEYGPPYVDNNDADSPELNAQLFEVTLRAITQGSDNLYRLEGPYVRIIGTSSSPAYQPPAEEEPGGFRYTRSDDRFEAVMAYYHIDKSQRYLQTLDVGFPIKEAPVHVNPQGFTIDNSTFDTNNLLRFGTGAIDDAEDADVIWHEYGHVLLNDTAPGLFSTDEGKALHEGWADYWAASYSRFLSEDDPQIPAHRWERLFQWDGNNDADCWYGRVLDHPGHYPDQWQYPSTGCENHPSIYEWGLLWATTLMEIYPHVGRSVLDRLNLASHAYLSSRATFVDAAEAMIQADVDLYDGAHTNVLIAYLSARGYVDEADYGPIVMHDPLPFTERTGGTVRLEVTAAPTSAPIDSVYVYYGTGGQTDNRLILLPSGGDLYVADLPLPLQRATVSYYVEAVDATGRRRSLPAGAPAETFSFDVGPDQDAPVIQHQPVVQASPVGWPLDVYAVVEDNLGIDSVWVEYMLEGPGGGVFEQGSFELMSDGETYFGRFPATANKLEEGAALSYRILARDASSSGNVGRLPATGMFRVSFVEEGILRSYDFEGISQGLVSTGLWARGKPTFGLRVAHSGERLWATNLAGAYDETARRSSLELPALDLSGIPGTVYLIFWHWYDFEHDGDAEPGVFKPSVSLWDGANVKASTDGGVTWVVLAPESGYNGVVDPQYQNPLGGEQAFGGYSHSWRREIVALPAGENVRIRFDFGSDSSNDEEARYFAGWYLDDITLTTQRPEDDTPPVATILPEARMVRVPGQEDPPVISVEVTDDTGIDGVWSQYDMTVGNETTSGSLRLAMADTDLNTYSGPVVPAQPFAPGDRIEYQIILRDFDGNESVYGDPFVIDYRMQQQTRVLQNAVATGAWRRLGSTWSASQLTQDPVSSLVLAPFTLPTNSESTELAVEHSFHLGSGLGGNVKISSDDGETWTLLTPEGGYPSTLQSDHPMSGQGVFADDTVANVSSFDLSAYAGQEVRVRLDFAQTRSLDQGEAWNVQNVAFRALTVDLDLTTELELRLHANFPDPVSDRTTLTYTIPSQMPVRISIYDMLGRRVVLIRHANHDPGTYTINYEAAGLANGVYMIFMETTAGTRTERMVVAR